MILFRVVKIPIPSEKTITKDPYIFPNCLMKKGTHEINLNRKAFTCLMMKTWMVWDLEFKPWECRMVGSTLPPNQCEFELVGPMILGLKKSSLFCYCCMMQLYILQFFFPFLWRILIRSLIRVRNVATSAERYVWGFRNFSHIMVGCKEEGPKRCWIVQFKRKIDLRT